NQMEEEANKIFDEIDNFGGVIPAIETGYFQKEIARSAYRYQLELEKKEKFIVGINEFVDEESKIDIPILHIPKEVETKQKERLKKLKNKRDQKKVDESLEKINYAAAHDGNLMRVFVEAAENYVTLGEMVNELKNHFGIYEETAQF
ncbi:Methylmalonyl-CoA mutase, partial [hydrothermal vent metagenome]